MKDKFNQLLSWEGEHWRGLLTGLFIAAVAILTLSLQLNTLIDGQNQYETSTLAQYESFPAPWQRMVNAPYTIPAYVVGNILDNPLLGARFVSVVYSLLATVLLFVILKRWHTIQIASIGSLLFITSSWVLAISHQATPLVMLIFTPLLLLAGITSYVNARKHSYISFLILLISLAFAAYIPYMIWMIGAIFIVLVSVYRKKLLKLSRNQVIIAATIYLLLLIPALISLSQFPGQLHELLGIPKVLPSITQYLANFLGQFASIFIISKSLPELYVGRLPLLDIFSSVMLILGIYHFARYMPKRRKITMASSLAILLLIVPLSPVYQISMAVYVAYIYIFIPSGVNEMLRQWFERFPRNPFARNLAVIIMVTVIGFATFYNLQRFYVAWPNAPQTKSAYMIQSDK